EGGAAALAGFGEARVVDVGDVAHVADLVAELLEATDEEVVGEIRGRVTEVRRVVRRDPAYVHTHRGRRFERHDRAAGGVVEAHVHERTLVLDCAARFTPFVRSDRGEPQAGAHLVPDVDGQQHGGEGFHTDGVSQRSTIERTEPRDAARDLHHGRLRIVVVT